MKSDIKTKQDIEKLVDTFYSKVQVDPLLAPVFAHVNWSEHLPVMYSFWTSMLLGTQTYTGNPLQRHLHLKIDHNHFQAWLSIWHQTIDELFSGPVAEETKMRGRSIAGIFQFKMGIKAVGSD
jgi:hemoglobin